ncbi:MAG: hypothetical protein NZM12_05450 [Steroidobacteraceae bacterium]|nr:hypothetical protein [Steroidobacteraceae bacterium]MDW8258890.1 hypothetical protein [Gammaproteobacteria bacterium]
MSQHRNLPLLRAALALLPVPWLASCALQSNSPVASGLWPIDRFCSEAQRVSAATPLRAANVIHGDFDAFVKSKPRIRPLETQQYHWFEAEGSARLKMISCKMKTADHLRTEYGESQAGAEGTCAALNQRTIDLVLAQVRRPRFNRVLTDPDELTTSGPVWLAPYEIAYRGADGALHVKSKGMRNDWLDPRYLDAPPQFRGTRYCHLIAPEYLRRILLGETPVP